MQGQDQVQEPPNTPIYRASVWPSCPTFRPGQRLQPWLLQQQALWSLWPAPWNTVWAYRSPWSSRHKVGGTPVPYMRPMHSLLLEQLVSTVRSTSYAVTGKKNIMHPPTKKPPYCTSNLWIRNMYCFVSSTTIMSVTATRQQLVHLSFMVYTMTEAAAAAAMVQCSWVVNHAVLGALGQK